MFRGRKITDPVVQGSASGGLESKPTGLTKAWDTVGKARADLRKIEHRLDQAERHPASNHLNPTGETSITDYGSLAWNRDHDTTYDVADEYASGAVVDNYGRSAYLKSKTNAARKVNRHDDKHIERADAAENRQKKSKSHGNHVGRHKSHTLHLQEKNYNRLDYNSHGMNDRRVEFSDRVNLRENSTSNQHGYNSSTRDRRPLQLIPDAHSTLTDSRDIRETEINFLNNNLTQDIDTNEQFLGGNPASRLTHVSVTVPGSTRHNNAASAGYISAGTQQRARPSSHFLDMISENSNSEMDGRASDDSQSDTESSKGRRFKADIRNIDPDGLAKIKETIRKQIKSSSSSKENNDELAGATGGDQAQSLGYAPTHTLHDANEPLMPRSQDLIEGSEKNHTRVRKIAAGPAPPSYKGFSEAEVRYRIVENKVPKSDSSKKDKKRVVSIRVQEKKIEPHSNWLTVEDADGGKSKKVTRVIAPSRKPSKQQAQPKNKEIITTSSWRAGQELILRELGPLKVRKSSRGRDSNSDIDGHESPMEERPDALGVEDMDNLGVGSATAAEIQHHKALSEEARRVYSDLQMDEDAGNPGKWNPSSLEKEKRWKAPTKRKARTSESEKQQQPSAKQRHYDQEQVRKYMQKQKAERLKRQKEEEMKQKEEEEARKKQLEELYNKQKQATVGSGPKKEKSSKQRVPGQEAGQKTSLGDLPRHHPFHTDRPKYVVSSDSENKENMNAEDDMEFSDSSSTLTGDEDELTPTGTPRRAKMDIDSPSNKKQTVNSLTREINKVGSKSRTVNASKPPDNVPSNLKTIGDFTFDVGVVTSKFTQALQERLNEDPPSSYNNGAFNSVNNQDGNRQGVSRADRIQAIKETAATLQNRLKAEAKKIEAQGANKITENGATYNPSVRWNDLEPSRPREEEYVSRYERVTAAKEDFTVFKSNLPGTQPEARLNAPNAMSSMPVASSGSRKDYVEDNTLTETSTFSEITLTDDSDDEMSHGKIGAGLKHQEFHMGSKTSDKPAPLNIPRPKSVQTAPKASNSWEDPVTDDFNVFSVYSRRQQERIIRPGREPMTKKKTSSTYSAPVEEDEVRATQASANQAMGGTSQKGDMSSRRAESPYGSRSESLRTQSPSLKMKSRTGSVMSKPPEPSDDETIDEDSYTDSFETEDKTTSRGKVVSESVPQSHKSLPTSMKSTSVKSASVKSTSKKSDRVASQAESSIDEDISEGDLTPQPEGSLSDTEPKDPPRLSPNSLERKFYSEFHNLESMEMSLKQLTGVERTRAVSMAQQETVSLAQILKAKQQGYDIQMKEIQLKAQLEATEATKQLEEARKRASEAAINAADMIAKVRGEGVTSIQESTRKLIDTQTEAAKATAEAAKYLSEARSRGNKDATHLAVKTAASAAASAVNTVLEKKRKSSNQTGGAKPKVYSKTAKRRPDEPVSHEESDIDDYSIHFDEQMTEDEIEEKSFRLILPSESHRKKGRHHSDNESVTSEGSAPKVLDSDLQSLFAGVESFDRFTDDIVKQFMKEEELREHHQASLLRLREEALVEKTKAELQWLEQQRKRIRNKGADDSYPQIAKRETRLKEKLQEQQAEIRKMREEQKKAAKERQRQLLEEISKRKGSKSQTLVKGRLGRPNEVHTEFEVSSIDEASDVEKQPKKDYKSDSEIYTEPKVNGRKTKHDNKDGEKYKKINLDEKFLTMRHHKLVNRRKNAEELLKWKKRLDEEEKRVFNLEKKVLKVWDKKDGPQKEKDPSSIKSVTAAKDESETYKKEPATNGTTRDSTIRTAVSEAKDSTVISEIISTARDSSVQENYITASIESSPDEKHMKMLTDKSNIKKAPRSGSESSITEEIPFSPDESKKMNDSSDDTMTQSYSETFDESATPTPKTASKKTGKTTPKSPLENLKKLRNASPRSSPRSLFSRSHTRNSESESEDSISHTESQSELSDFEGRIRALNEDLRRRKTEADRLKRETKKKRRELMKNKELTLKKQIEAYDNQINQLKIDLHKEMSHETAKTTVRPKIKQPKVSPPKGLKSTSVTPPKLRTETDSSGPDSTQVSPDIQEDAGKRKKADVSEPISSKSALEKISEGSESITSRSEKSDPTYKEKSHSQKGSSVEEESVVEEIEEDIASIASEPSDDKTKEMKIDLHTKEDLYDVSTVYTEDFETEPVSHNATQHDKVPLSARSFASDDQPQSARSVTEAISEYIPEHVSAASASESFVRQLDLKQQINNNDIDQNNEDPSERDLESDNDNSISYMESSRPSSGRSERSIPSYQTEHESSESSEKSPALVQEKLDDVVHDEVSEPSSSYSKKKPIGLSSRNLYDIDDLLGPPDEDDLTPLGSPKSKDETPRDKDSGNFFDALTDFNIGDRVTVTGTNRERCSATLLFKGNVKFAPGIWVGVELDKPEGRHDGVEEGTRYFRCKNKHGLIVPGHDLQPETDERGQTYDNVRTSMESTVSVDTEEGDLARLIREADENVQMFDKTPEPSPRSPQRENDKKARNERLADMFTDDLLASVIQKDMDIISDIAAKQQSKKNATTQKKAPPVAPKPSKDKKETTSPALTNGDIQHLDEHQQTVDQPTQQTRNFENTANDTVKKLVSESIDHMLAIRSNRQNMDKDQSRDSGNFTDGVEEEHQEGTRSPTDELKGVLDRQDDNGEGLLDTPLRPGSPVPGLQSHKESHKPVEDSGNFDGEYDDELWLPPKEPPPYSSDAKPDVGRPDLRKLADEVFYAVPHQTEEINSIVSSAVDEYWTQRRYGESLSDVQPSEKYFTQEENGTDLISNSRRVFKRLLFDLTGEIVRTIYKEEENDSPAPWKKPKHKQNKYHKGAGTPTTVDVLKPAVQEAVIDILGLNGSKKPDRSRWGVRNKKKDLVDNILVQELREEEPEWVNYDDDELAVKMQLTETIFENLLTDTVHTMNRIYRRKQSLQQQ